ncbi:ATP-binding response regulator [Methylocystis heyeri]|uniref:histidine kinase n=1 Tax=Methylocystis heyeri TaxID=391905 RepID=A0A6B8K7T0_9HYPH|nr:hybrid sensor histidine kinase/response regulator [Methylocystis heyeri]QGM44264.1 response regulator [Methylocystis heyeri]
MSSAEPSASCDRIRAEQIKMLYRIGPVGIAGAAVAAVFLVAALAFSGRAPPPGNEIWLASVAIAALCHLLLCRRYWRAAPAVGAWRPWARSFVAFSAIEGMLWGVPALALTARGEPDQYLLTLVVATNIASGAALAFGSYLPAFYLLLFPAITPYGIASLFRDNPIDGVIALLVPVHIVAFSALAVRGNGNFTEALRLRFENMDLARELLGKKEAAEQANIAKSSFLAAASHDLRQPVHALGMFVGALQAHPMNHEMRRLVEQIGGSVSAMDDLFNSLLDISRLDAGVVEPRIETFPIQPVLARVCSDYEAESREKRVRLVLHPCSAIVRTDPILIERILRNLVSNAVRYTDQGRVVVGCRLRNGLSVEVWDTGRGIPAERHKQVFQEFYQLGNPERDRSKGLGLGLAIVHRLSSLLGCRVTLCSREGKGSAFKIEAPLAHRGLRSAAPAREAHEGATACGLILVIDDEAAIQQAMTSLLAGWGHEVIAAGSCAEMLERVAICPLRPDLIISDYRLRAGENGIAVVERLRLEYNDDIPAMLITGDTAPDRLKEAQESGLLLLHKPLSNGKLRAAIRNLMQTSSEPKF